jgi:DNA-binding MarR family transcriptional regulator
MSDLAIAVDRVVAAVVRERSALAALRGDVTATDLLALSYLRRREALSPGALGRALLLSPSGTTAVIHRLVDAGLAVRSPGPANHRDVRVSATPEGVALGMVAVPSDDDVRDALAAESDTVALIDVVAEAAERRAAEIIDEEHETASRGAGVPGPVPWGWPAAP